MQTITNAQGKLLIEGFDDFTQESLHLISPNAADFNLAQLFVKNFSTKLRGPDALHLAVVSNHSMDEMLSLDANLLSAAKMLKIAARRGIRG